MNKNIRNKTVALVVCLFILMCTAFAFAPLWINSCVPTYLNEEEIEQMRNLPNYQFLSLEKQIKVDKLHREVEIPCGAENLPVFEKLQASRFQGMILSELRVLRPIILRVELVRTSEPSGTYYYQAYTFFFIKIFEGFGGGSGYMEITPFPFLHHVIK